MSSVAEIEAAIEQLSPAEVNQLAVWLETHRQQALNATSRVPADATVTRMRGGVPLLPSRGEVITPDKIRRLREQEGI